MPGAHMSWGNFVAEVRRMLNVGVFHDFQLPSPIAFTKLFLQFCSSSCFFFIPSLPSLLAFRWGVYVSLGISSFLPSSAILRLRFFISAIYAIPTVGTYLSTYLLTDTTETDVRGHEITAPVETFDYVHSQYYHYICLTLPEPSPFLISPNTTMPTGHTYWISTRRY